MLQDKESLKNEFISNIDFETLVKNKLKKTIVISFVASIGSGKSTIAKILSERLNIPILDNDGIRRFLNEKGIEGESPLPELVIDIARTRMRIVLEKGISYILDADLTLTAPQDFIRIKDLGGTLLLIKIECPEELVLSRIRRRTSATTTSLANEKRYFERQKLRESVKVEESSIFYTFDNSLNLEAQMEILIKKIRDFETE